MRIDKQSVDVSKRHRPWRLLGVLLPVVVVAGCSSADEPDAADASADSASIAVESSTTEEAVELPAQTAPETSAASTSTTSPAVTSTTTTIEAPPTTVAGEPALWPSLERFLEFYSASSEAVASDTGGETFTVSVDDVVIGEVDGFDRGFAATAFFDAGIMVGTLNETDEVTSALLLFDPDGQSAADALSAFLVSMLGSSTSFELNALLEEYAGLVTRSRDGAGEQLWFTNTSATNHSLVVTVVEGAVAGDNLIEVAVVPVADEESAKAAVQVVRPSLLSLVPVGAD